MNADNKKMFGSMVAENDVKSVAEHFNFRARLEDESIEEYRRALSAHMFFFAGVLRRPTTVKIEFEGAEPGE